MDKNEKKHIMYLSLFELARQGVRIEIRINEFRIKRETSSEAILSMTGGQEYAHDLDNNRGSFITMVCDGKDNTALKDMYLLAELGTRLNIKEEKLSVDDAKEAMKLSKEAMGAGETSAFVAMAKAYECVRNQKPQEIHSKMLSGEKVEENKIRGQKC